MTDDRKSGNLADTKSTAGAPALPPGSLDPPATAMMLAPLQADQSIGRLTVGDLRWILKWNGNIVRALTLYEVQQKQSRPAKKRPSRKKRR
jgi:hypothetical protein